MVRHGACLKYIRIVSYTEETEIVGIANRVLFHFDIRSKRKWGSSLTKGTWWWNSVYVKIIEISVFWGFKKACDSSYSEWNTSSCTIWDKKSRDWDFSQIYMICMNFCVDFHLENCLISGPKDIQNFEIPETKFVDITKKNCSENRKSRDFSVRMFCVFVLCFFVLPPCTAICLKHVYDANTRKAQHNLRLWLFILWIS